MARRARGAGAVFQRADGRWEAQLRIGPSRRRSWYAQTRRDVVVRLDQARWSMPLGLPVRMPVTRTVADLVREAHLQRGGGVGQYLLGQVSVVDCSGH